MAQDGSTEMSYVVVGLKRQRGRGRDTKVHFGLKAVARLADAHFRKAPGSPSQMRGYIR